MGASIVMLFFVVFMGGFFVYPMISRKKILRAYNGKMKAIPSMIQFCIAFCLSVTTVVMAISGIVMILELFKGNANFLTVLIYLIFVCGFGAITYFYFRRRMKKLGELFPEVPSKRVMFEQCVLGLGTLDYICVCSLFFFVSFFGVKLFDIDLS